MLFVKKYQYPILLMFVFLISVIIVWPLGNFPLNDDWSYSKSVQILTEEYKVNIGEWGAMTLLTHLLWGGIFVKLFGFSFFILRISTLISSCIGLLFLFKTLKLLTNNENISFFGCLCLLFYPVYFNLSNTFMTDVNFNTLLILACYCAARYHSEGGRFYFAMIFIISAALVLLRQFGILVPLSFTLSCLFIPQNRIRSTVTAILLSTAVYALFLYYEEYLKTILTDGAAYKFSGSLNLKDPEFYDSLISRLNVRWKMIFVHLSLYSLPITLPLLLRSALKAPRWFVAITVILSGLLAHILFHKVNPLIGNIFGNMYLGAETWYESLSDLPPDHAHTYSVSFQKFMEVLKQLSTTVSCSCLLLGLFSLLQARKITTIKFPLIIFLAAFFVTYIGTLFISEAYFDRYHIPLITVLILVLGIQLNNTPRQPVAMPTACIVLTLYFYFSVAGTSDYFRVNETRWSSYLQLRDKQGIDGGTVNAGFEVNYWNDGKPGWWTNMSCTEPYTWLIQYRPEKEFQTIRKYTFERIFPPGTDTVRVMKRIDLK